MQRKNKWKMTAMILAMSLFTSMLAGCSVRQRTLSVAEEETEIHFSWWGNDERHQYTLEGMKLFENDYPQIRVKSNYAEWNGFRFRMGVDMAAHMEADVMQINYSWLYEYSQEDEYFCDLTKYAKYLDLSNYTEEELAYGTTEDGVLRAIPIAMNTQTFYYNQSIYDSYGLEIPKTWQDLFDAAVVMREDGIYPMSMEINQLMRVLTAYVEQLTGKKFMEMDGTINYTEEESAIMLDFYKKLIDEKVMPSIEDFEEAKIIDGTFAGTVTWINEGDYYWDEVIQSGQTVTIGEYLSQESGSDLSGWYIKPATLYAISANTKAPKEAAQLLNFLVNSPEMAKLQGIEKGVPLSNTALESLEETDLLSGIQYEANQMMEEDRENMELSSPYFENMDMAEDVKAAADAYLYEKETLEECAGKIYEIFKACSR